MEKLEVCCDDQVNLFVDNYSNYVQPPGFKIQASETLQENEDAVKAFVEGLKVISSLSQPKIVCLWAMTIGFMRMSRRVR